VRKRREEAEQLKKLKIEAKLAKPTVKPPLNKKTFERLDRRAELDEQKPTKILV
jgi:hypothetical protein